jgi:hypothetical protein
MDWVDALGWTGSAASCLIVAPQAWRTWTHRHDAAALSGVSVAAMLFVVANSVVWAAWAVLEEAYPAGLPSLINGPAAAATAVAVVIGRRRQGPGDQSSDSAPITSSSRLRAPSSHC